MQTLVIPLHRPEIREPGGMERNVFRLGRRFMDPNRAEERQPFPELFWFEREFPADEPERRANHWQSYNAAAHNINSARLLTQAAANHISEAALMLTLVQTMIDEAIESDDAATRNLLAERIASVLGNIDSSFRGLSGAIERIGSVYVNGSDSFIAQVGIHEGQMREIEINQVNTRSLGLGDGQGNISLPNTFEEMRGVVADAITTMRTERMNVFAANLMLDSERSALDLNRWGNDAVQPGTVNPPLGDDASQEEQLRRTEAERAMRMARLRQEVGTIRTLFGLIEHFSS